MPRALVLGGTGVVGLAVATRLLRAGWDVDLTGRQPAHMPLEVASAGASYSSVDRDDTAGLLNVLGDGADLLVDCACYTAAQATALLPLLPAAGSAVMLSSKAVYVDAEGRHVNSELPARFDGPIREDQSTMRPSDASYLSREGYGANKVAAEEVLLDSGYPVTILRPSKVHGRWNRLPREWVFVKRVLDLRPVVVLARAGAGADHPSAAANIAALVEVVAATPRRQILNIADPDTPSGLKISRIVAARLGHAFAEVLLGGATDGGGGLDDRARDETLGGALGRHPWDYVPPIVLDTTAALALGYQPVGDYATTVADEIDWLVDTARAGDPDHRLPSSDDPYFAPMVDYEVEDRYLAAHR